MPPPSPRCAPSSPPTSQHTPCSASTPRYRDRRGAIPRSGSRAPPDLIIAPDSRYGNGPGIAIVEPIEPAQWRTRWRHTEGYPWPTPEARARIEALFLLYPTDWGIIIPQVGWGPPRPALRVTPDDTLKARLHQEIGAIDHALVRGRPPAPDARADRACLAHLASLSAPARIEPRTTDDAQGDVIRREINTTEERRRELDAARLRFDEARASYDNAVLALTQAAGGAGTVLLDDVILRITAEPVAFVPAHRHRTRIDVERSGEQATYHTH